MQRGRGRRGGARESVATSWLLYTTKGGATTFGTAPLSLLTLNSTDDIELHRYYFLNLRKSDILNRKRRINSFIVQNITINATAIYAT